MRPQSRYQPGDKIGRRYQVHQALMGGMGEVYLCLDLETNLPFALKTFQQRYLTNPKVRELFEEEVATWVALEKHPNIVRCFYMDIIDNQPFMFLEWIAGDESRGTDLRSWLRYGPLDLRLALDFTIDICRGLIHAGQKQPGIVHRDLKPENILVAQGRLAKITDWGLAKIVQTAELEITGAEGQTDGRQSLLRQGGIVGTPPYMAPEQWQGEELDVRTDIYAVGCILYELLTGHWPFAATTLVGLRRQDFDASITTLMNGEMLPATLGTLLPRCMAKQRDERFATVDDLLQELLRIYQQQFTETPRTIGRSGGLTAADLRNRGNTYYMLKRYKDALADLNRAIQLGDNSAGVYSSRANVHHGLRRYEEALVDYSQALQRDPGSAPIYTNRGDTYNCLQRYDEALADFTRAIQLDPDLALTYCNRANTYADMQRYDEALVDLNRAIQLDPTFALAYANRGIVHAFQQRYDEALADHTIALKLDPTLTRAYMNRGVTYGMLQRHSDALADFAKGIQFDPNNAIFYYKRGQTYKSLHQYEEALADFSRALELDPALTECYNDRGVLLTQLKRYDEALAALRKAIQLDPNDTDVVFNMGAILTIIELQRYHELSTDFSTLLGISTNMMQAMSYFEKALELGHSEAEEQIARLSNYLGEMGTRVNNAGYQLLQAGQFDEAFELLQLSIKLCRRINDGVGEVLALENSYLALRAAQRYSEALGVLAQVLDSLISSGNVEKCQWYVGQVTQAIEILRQLGPVCIVRKTYYDVDLQSCLEKHGAQAKVLVLEDTEHILEVMAHISEQERQLFLNTAMEKLEQYAGPPAHEEDPYRLPFSMFQHANSLNDMRVAMSRFPFMADPDFFAVIQQAVERQVPPGLKPAFKQRLAWLRQIADEQKREEQDQ